MLHHSHPEPTEPVARSSSRISGSAPAGPMERPRSNERSTYETAYAAARATAAELLCSYSTLLFIRSRFVGAVLLLTTFLNVNVGASGILSWLTTIAFARIIGIGRENPVHGVYTYNALIVGFSIGFLFRVSFLSLLLTVGASVLTVLVSCTLFSLLSSRLKLPVLNVPFLIVSTILYLASIRYSALFVDSFHVSDNFNLSSIPAFLQGLLRSFGILIFMPYDLCGIFILTALLVFSRIAFFTAVSSYCIGISTLSLLTGSFANAGLEYGAFNFILIGVALGGVFLIPSRRSYALACIGVFASVFVLDASSIVCSTYGIPIFTLPFNMVVLLFILVLMHTGYPYITRTIKASPEASLSNYLNFAQRFDYVMPRPFLPFAGRWNVYQGFDGKWTHTGVWKYAYDFVIHDDRNQTHRNGGEALEDYYCYGKPVLSPVGGTVVEANDSFKDNPVGEVDRSNNWGNYVIIYCPVGYYVEISHLQFHSLRVHAGDTVKVGEAIAACGNSGYSPQPHIHMQVQYRPQLGSETARFCFANCLDDRRRLVEKQALEEGMTVEPFSFSKRLSRVLTFILDDSFTYKFFKDTQETGAFRLVVKMAADGSCYFSIDGTEDRLYFGFESNRFVFYSFEGNRDSPLELLFAALPKVPMCSENAVGWDEALPDNLLFRRNPLYSFFKSFHHDAGRVTGSYEFADGTEVVGVVSNGKQSVHTRLVFDELKGFKEIHAEASGIHYAMIRVDDSWDSGPGSGRRIRGGYSSDV